MAPTVQELVDQGRRDAEQHFDALAAAYETLIRQLGREAVQAFIQHQWRRPAPIAAAAGMPPWRMPDADEVMNVGRAAARMREQTGAFRTRIVSAAMGGIVAHYGIAFDLSNPLLRNVFAQLGGKITHITESIRSDIMTSIQESYDAGLSIRDTGAAIRSSVNAIAKYRSEMIARTEMTTATSGGSWAAVKMINAASPGDAQMRKIWIATEDDRTRDAHLEAGDIYGEGNGIPVDQPFIVDGEPLMYPGDDGSPENTINCRCTIGYEQRGGAVVAGGGYTSRLTATPDGYTVRRVAGRVPIFPLRLKPELRERLEAAANERGVSLSEYLRTAGEAFAELTVTGAAGLPLGDRDESWDAAAAEAAMTGADQLGRYHFWRDPDGDPDVKASYKLPFGTPTPNGHAVWAGVTACAAVLQGGRGGVDIPQADQDQIKGRVGAYYAAAAKKYDDATIVPPWENGGAACIDNQQALAALEPAQTQEAAVGRSEQPGVQYVTLTTPTGLTVAIHDGSAELSSRGAATEPFAPVPQDQPADPPAAPPEEDVQPADEPHAYKPIDPADAPDGACAVCGKPMSDPIHEGFDEGDDEELHGHPLLVEPIQANGFRILFAIAAPGTGEEGDSPEPPLIPAGAGTPFRALLAVEGVPTDDGRMIEKGALGWREPPLTLMATIEDSHGGMPTTKTMVCGRIDTIERVDTGEATADIVGTGVFDTGDVGAEIARLVDEKMMRGVSVDLSVKQAEEVTGEAAGEDGIEDPLMGESYLLVVKDGTIMGATVCPFPAFSDADIETLVAAAHSGDHLPNWVMPYVEMVETDGEVGGPIIQRIAFLGTFQPDPMPDVAPPPGGDTGGGMIAVYPQPDEASALADPDGNITADSLHVTLFHFTADTWDPDTLGQLLADFAQGYGPISGDITGAGVFSGGPSSAASEEEDETEETSEPAGEDETQDGTSADPDVPQVLLVDALGLGELRFDLADLLENAGVAYSTDHDFIPHITTDYDDPADVQYNQGLTGSPVTFTALSLVAEDGTRADVPLAAAMTASAAGMAPVKPPSAWFDYPDDVEGLTPITVTDEGRVYGHVAAFNECHIGSPPGSCITAPHHFRVDPHGANSGECLVCGQVERDPNHSRSGYDFFHLGELETEEGDLIRVGQLTLGTSHAPTSSITAKMAQEHYDNTAVAVADGVIYEDDIGPFFAGALRPDVQASRVREFRAAKPSGDWRGIKGRRELIGVLMVNKPGFPIPRRASRIEDGERTELALVAAGFPNAEAYGTQPCSGEEMDEIRRLVASVRSNPVADLVASARIDELIRAARQ